MSLQQPVGRVLIVIVSLQHYQSQYVSGNSGATQGSQQVAVQRHYLFDYDLRH